MSPASILLVDGDVTTRSQIARELRELGQDVSETNDAGGALKAVSQKRPDLMVLDWLLPDLAGIELLGDVKHSDDLKHVRVLRRRPGRSWTKLSRHWNSVRTILSESPSPAAN